MPGLIYLLTNLIEGKKYVGQSRRPLDIRFYEHVYKSNLGKGGLLGAAIREFGPDAFTRVILEDNIPDADLNDRERFWIAFHGTQNPVTGYNLTKGGDSPISPGVPQKRRGKPREKAGESRARWKNAINE